MKTFRTNRGPFAERPHYELADIERICTAELKRVECLPGQPEPVRIDRFIEKRFGITPEYDDLGENVLGYTRFGENGAMAVVISRSLDQDGTAVSDRRVRTTLAHEAGHILLQGHLFSVGKPAGALFGANGDVSEERVLCREDASRSLSGLGYDGKWWEWQANRAIGALLLPRALVFQQLEPLLTERGLLKTPVLEAARRLEAERLLAGIFDVNPIVARLRLEELWPSKEETQLRL